MTNMKHRLIMSLVVGVAGWILGWTFFNDGSLDFYVVTAIVVFGIYQEGG